MKKIFIILPLFLSGFLFSQKKPQKKVTNKTAIPVKLNYHQEFEKISDEIMTNGKAYDHLGELTKGIGPRFSATTGYEKAVEWAEKKFKEIGINMIWRQEAKAPVWIRGKESLHIKTGNGDWKNIRMLSFGNSEGTGGKDLTGEIVLINSTSELNAMSIGQLKDKIVFVNVPMDPKIINTSDAYLQTAKSKLISASVIAKTGAKALIIRSLTTASDDVPHAKMIYYEPDDKVKIPALSIGVKSADELEKILKSKKSLLKST
ncbi:hypothetical protein [Chryseobacterium sp. UNC8MFCol]|uniref:hypothetical protein n=1 Tax=Chryseobacterium sp. UNC8MFCol TaxID=1340435 RepID=UPI000B143B51|nr:hypothetical protein [Chryseobacterium sp. UNC8MFCol]